MGLSPSPYLGISVCLSLASQVTSSLGMSSSLELSKLSQFGELKCGLVKHWIFSLFLHIAVSLSHSFVLVLLTEHLSCASTVQDTGNAIVKETWGRWAHEAHNGDDPHDSG